MHHKFLALSRMGYAVPSTATLWSDVTLHLVGVFVSVLCRTMHIGAGQAP